MKTLIEDLHSNNVIFSYYGFIDSSVLSQVLQITRSKLESNEESPVIIERVHDALNNCVENIIKNNFYPEDDKVQFKSLLAVSKKDEQYHVDTIAVVNPVQKESIIQQLHFLKTKSKDELMALKSRTMLHVDDSVPMGSGLIEIALKVDDCNCTFRDLEQNSLFNINFRINSLN